MPSRLKNVWVQPLAVVGGTECRMLEEPDLLGRYGGDWASIGSGSVTMEVPPSPAPQTLRVSFSSVPVIAQSEIDTDYQELGEALGELTQVEFGEDWTIEGDVLDTARAVAVDLWSHAIPAPRVFSHGPKSLVFNWWGGNTSLYLTISSNHLSALISTPERIKQRLQFSKQDMIGLRGLAAAGPDRQMLLPSSASTALND